LEVPAYCKPNQTEQAKKTGAQLADQLPHFGIAHIVDKAFVAKLGGRTQLWTTFHHLRLFLNQQRSRRPSAIDARALGCHWSCSF
jgi:hypothetical protein